MTKAGRDLFWLTEEQFTRIKPYLPTDTRGVPRVDGRRGIRLRTHELCGASPCATLAVQTASLPQAPIQPSPLYSGDGFES